MAALTGAAIGTAAWKYGAPLAAMIAAELGISHYATKGEKKRTAGAKRRFLEKEAQSQRGASAIITTGERYRKAHRRGPSQYLQSLLGSIAEPGVGYGMTASSPDSGIGDLLGGPGATGGGLPPEMLERIRRASAPEASPLDRVFATVEQ